MVKTLFFSKVFKFSKFQNGFRSGGSLASALGAYMGVKSWKTGFMEDMFAVENFDVVCSMEF